MNASEIEQKRNSWAGIEEDVVRGLYLGLLGRDPDMPGMLYWVTRLQAGDSVDTIAREILLGPECSQRKKEGMFHRSYHALCANVAEWARQALMHAPLSLVDLGTRKLRDDDHFYEALRSYDIPYHIHTFGPLEYFRQKHDSQQGRVTRSPDFICDGNVHHFHLHEPDYLSSFLPFHPRMSERFADDSQFTTIRVDTVPTKTLDSAMRNKEHIDWLGVNMYGMELLTLQHAVECLQRTEVVDCSVSFIDMYEGQSCFRDVDQFMREQGFDLIDFYNHRHYAFPSTPYSWSRDIVGQVGAVFFRRLDASSSVRSVVSQSLLALLGYEKPSLAAWLVKNLDSSGHPLAKLFAK